MGTVVQFIVLQNMKDVRDTDEQKKKKTEEDSLYRCRAAIETALKLERETTINTILGPFLLAAVSRPPRPHFELS
jgi:hypothetical protein